MKSQYVIIKERKISNGKWCKVNEFVFITGIIDDVIYYKSPARNGSFGITIGISQDSIVYSPVVVDVNGLVKL